MFLEWAQWYNKKRISETVKENKRLKVIDVGVFDWKKQMKDSFDLVRSIYWHYLISHELAFGSIHAISIEPKAELVSV